MTKGIKGKNLNSEFIFTYVVNIVLRVRNFINFINFMLRIESARSKTPKIQYF